MRNFLSVTLSAMVILAAGVPQAQAAKGVKKVGGMHNVRGQLTSVQMGGAGNTGSIHVRSGYSHRKFGFGGNNNVGNNNVGNNGGRGTQHVFQVTPATNVVATHGYQRSTGTLASLRQGMHVRVTAMNQVAQTVQVVSQGGYYNSYHRHYRPHYTGRNHRPYSYNHNNTGLANNSTPKTTTAKPTSTASSTKPASTSLTHHATPKTSTTKSSTNSTNSTTTNSTKPITHHHTVALHRSVPVHHSAPVHVSMPHFSAHHSSGGHHHGGHH